MKSSCPYCGNNPVPHHIYWYNESLNIWLTPLRQVLLYNRLTFALKKYHWDVKFFKFLLFFGKSLKIISLQNDLNKCKVQRAKVLWQEAEKRGLSMKELLFFGMPFDTYIAEKDDKTKIIFSGLPRPSGYSNNWLDLMDDKWLLKEKLIKNNFPVPAGLAVTSFAKALEIFNKISKPVIVKPRAGSRGRHSVTFINSPAELKQAYRIAKQLCYWVIVEEQLLGPVYRATVVNFKLCGVLRGDAPQILGDGIHSIAELIAIKNSSPHAGVKNILADSAAELFLSRQNLKFSSVPSKGQIVYLSEKIGVNYGGSSSEDFEICHPDNKVLFEKAARLLGDPIVGFDFIIPDVAKSFTQQKCGFIEVNSLPFINLHHDPLLGRPMNVAAKVWEMVGL